MICIYGIIMCFTSSCTCGTVGPRLSKSPLSEPLVIRRLFRILKSQKIVWFSTNQEINEIPVWFLDLLGLIYHGTVKWKHNSRHDIVGHPCDWLTVMRKNIIVYS